MLFHHSTLSILTQVRYRKTHPLLKNSNVSLQPFIMPFPTHLNSPQLQHLELARALAPAYSSSSATICFRVTAGLKHRPHHHESSSYSVSHVVTQVSLKPPVTSASAARWRGAGARTCLGGRGRQVQGSSWLGDVDLDGSYGAAGHEEEVMVSIGRGVMLKRRAGIGVLSGGGWLRRDWDTGREDLYRCRAAWLLKMESGGWI
jgi:hypothetical protein